MYHHTTPIAAQRILSEGVIRPNGKGRVYLTPDNMSPEEAYQKLFIESPLYMDRTRVIAVEVSEEALGEFSDGCTNYEVIARRPIKMNRNGIGRFDVVA